LVEIVQVHDPPEAIVEGDEQTDVIYNAQNRRRQPATSVVSGHERLPGVRVHPKNHTPACPCVRIGPGGWTWWSLLSTEDSEVSRGPMRPERIEGAMLGLRA
jgi:hypothetical protein